MVCNTFPMLRKISFVREHWQKNPVMINKDFGCLRGWEVGLSDPIKKGKYGTKIFLSDNAEWSLKSLWKMISVNVKVNKNNKT